MQLRCPNAYLDFLALLLHLPHCHLGSLVWHYYPQALPAEKPEPIQGQERHLQQHCSTVGVG